MRRRLLAVAVALLAASNAGAEGEPGHSTPAESPVPDLVAAQPESEAGKGQCAIAVAWDELSKSAAAHGVSLSVVYDGEGFVNTTGGIRTGAAYVGNLHLQLTVDMERLLGCGSEWKTSRKLKLCLIGGAMKSSGSLGRSGGPAEISSQLDRLTEWRDRARTARVNWAQGAQAEAIRAAYRDGVKAASMVLRKAGHLDLAEKVTQLEKA